MGAIAGVDYDGESDKDDDIENTAEGPGYPPDYIEPDHDPEEIKNKPSSDQETPGLAVEISLAEALTLFTDEEPNVPDNPSKLEQ